MLPIIVIQHARMSVETDEGPQLFRVFILQQIDILNFLHKL